jgi:muramidase (phage lysozyme)
MSEKQANLLENPNVRTFLDFLGKAEGADYNVIVGGGKFEDFSKHPGIVGLRTKSGPSTAAGKYQITKRTYNDIAPKLKITDFSPESQDRIAVALIRRRGALNDVVNGNWDSAIQKLGKEWASLPTSPYPQPKKDWKFVAANLPKSASTAVAIAPGVVPAKPTVAAAEPAQAAQPAKADVAAAEPAPAPKMQRVSDKAPAPAPAPKKQEPRTIADVGELPESYRIALATNYLGDTEDESVADRALAMLEESEEEADSAPVQNTGLQYLQTAGLSIDPYQFLRQEVAQTTDQGPRRRVVPQMPQTFANGGSASASKSGVNRLKQARAVPAMPRFQDGGEVDLAEQMTVGTLPEDQRPAGEVFRGIGRDVVRGAQYLPYDLIGMPVDVINLGLNAVGAGTDKPFMGSEYLIDKAAQAGIAQRPTGSAAETATRIGMGFVNPATAARQIPRGIEAVRRGAEALELPGVAQTAPIGAIMPKGRVDTSVLLPKDNKPFIGEVERIVADLPGPVTKEQFLGMMRKKGRLYETARVEQALENLPDGTKISPADLMQKLQATSPSRYTTEIIPPGSNKLYNTIDNPFPSIKPGSVNLLLDMPAEQKQMADIAAMGRELPERLSRYDFLAPVIDAQRIPEASLALNPPASMYKKTEGLATVLTEIGQAVGKDPAPYVEALERMAFIGDDLNALNVHRAKIAYPALTTKWDKYTKMPKEQLPDELKDGTGFVDADKLVASVYDDGIKGIRSAIDNANFFKTYDFKDELQALDSLEALNNKFKNGKASYTQLREEAGFAERALTARMDMFTENLAGQAERLANNVSNLVKELPQTYFQGTHSGIVSRNPISFSRFVEFTPNQAENLQISMPDQDRGVIMFLELQSDRQKAVRLADDVEEAFPGMAKLPQVTQQLMIKNAIYGGAKMNKGLVLFPGSDSKQAQLYDKLGPNLKQVIKDLGPGFKAREFKFPNENGDMATRWGVYIDEDAAKRIQTQGIRFAKGGMVDKPLYDRAA